MNPQLRLFLAGTMLVGAAGGVFETTFNNFLNETYEVSAATRGFLEFPRELPGFLAALMAGALFFLPATMIAAVAAFAAGLISLGWSSSPAAGNVSRKADRDALIGGNLSRKAWILSYRISGYSWASRFRRRAKPA